MEPKNMSCQLWDFSSLSWKKGLPSSASRLVTFTGNKCECDFSRPHEREATHAWWRNPEMNWLPSQGLGPRAAQGGPGSLPVAGGSTLSGSFRLRPGVWPLLTRTAEARACFLWPVCDFDIGHREAGRSSLRAPAWARPGLGAGVGRAAALQNAQITGGWTRTTWP